MTDKDAILATLEIYAEAYCAKDTTRLMALFGSGDNISLIGTGNDELCSGRDEVEAVFQRNFRDASAEQFEWGWTDVAVQDKTAVVAVALQIHLKIADEKLIVPVRWTVSLVKSEGEWKWLHRHASVAAGGQEEGAAYPTD